MAKYAWELPTITTGTGATASNLQAANTASNFVNSLEQSFTQAGGGEYTGLGARVSGAYKGVTGTLGLNDPAKVYADSRKGFAATLKQLTGDTGVMTDQDYARLAGLLPTLGATPGEAASKFEQLRSQIAAKFGGTAVKSTYNAPESKGGLMAAVLPGITELYGQKKTQNEEIQQKLKSGDIGGWAKGVLGQGISGALPITNIYNPAKAIQEKSIGAGYNPAGAKAAGEIMTILGITDLAKAGISKVKGLTKGGALANRASVASQSTAQLSGDEIYNNAKGYIEKIGGIDKNKALALLDEAKDDIVGKIISPEDALSKLSQYNKAYTQLGAAGKSAKALANDALSKATRQQLTQVAPDVAAAQEELKTALGLGKNVRRTINTLGMGVAGIAALTYIINLLTGKKNQ